MKRLTKRDKCMLSHGEEIVICNHKITDIGKTIFLTKEEAEQKGV